MSDHRWLVLAGLCMTALAFLAGVRIAFERPKVRHRYLASRVSGTILVVEAIAIAAVPVPAGRAAAALALLGAAVMLFLWATWTNRARKLALAFAGKPPEHVQTRGPYRLVRHPFYTSYLLAFLGGGLAAGTLWLVPAIAAGIVTYWRAARAEERAFAQSALAEAYRRYASRVGMFLPRPPMAGRG